MSHNIPFTTSGSYGSREKWHFWSIVLFRIFLFYIFIRHTQFVPFYMNVYSVSFRLRLRLFWGSDFPALMSVKYIGNMREMCRYIALDENSLILILSVSCSAFCRSIQGLKNSFLSVVTIHLDKKVLNKE